MFSLKTQLLRKVRCTPNNNWGGQGALGASVKYDVLDTSSLGVHIIEVFPNSPAALAGLATDTDWILGTADRFLSTPDDLIELMVEAVESNARVSLFVFSSMTNSTREVTVEPTNKWGGKGLLGCIPAVGLIHRLPVLPPPSSLPAVTPKSLPVTSSISLPTPPPRILPDEHPDSHTAHHFGDASELRQNADFVSPSRIPIGSLPPPPTPGSQNSPIVLPPQSSLPLPPRSSYGGPSYAPPALLPPRDIVSPFNETVGADSLLLQQDLQETEQKDIPAASPIMQYHPSVRGECLGFTEPPTCIANGQLPLAAFPPPPATSPAFNADGDLLQQEQNACLQRPFENQMIDLNVPPAVALCANSRNVSFNECVALQPYDPSATPSATCVRSPQQSTFLLPDNSTAPVEIAVGVDEEARMSMVQQEEHTGDISNFKMPVQIAAENNTVEEMLKDGDANAAANFFANLQTFDGAIVPSTIVIDDDVPCIASSTFYQNENVVEQQRNDGQSTLNNDFSVQSPQSFSSTAVIPPSSGLISASAPSYGFPVSLPVTDLNMQHPTDTGVHATTLTPTIVLAQQPQSFVQNLENRNINVTSNMQQQLCGVNRVPQQVHVVEPYGQATGGMFLLWPKARQTDDNAIE